MSGAYARERSLVTGESNYYDRVLDTAIAMTVLTFLLGMVTLTKIVALDMAGGALVEFFVLFLAVGVGGIGIVGLGSYLGVTPITSQRLRGIALGLLVSLVGFAALAAVFDATLATLTGISLVLEAAIVLGAGIASSQRLVDTEPSPNVGMLAGIAFGIVGLALGAILAAVLSLSGQFAVYGLAVVVGLAMAVLALAPEEDLGTALPVAILVSLMGAVVATGSIDLSWTWSPGADIDGTFTGGVVIPLLALSGSMVASWGAAKSRAGYGARGRQYGSYLVIYLNAVLMVAIMFSIVAFVAMKGFSYSIHGFTIGAVSALVVLTPALVLALDYARSKAGGSDWHSGVRQFARVLPLAAVGSLVGLLAVVQVTGTPFEIPFTYTVFENRSPQVLDTAVSITPVPTVGNLLVLFVGLFCFLYCFRRYGSLRGVGAEYDRATAVERGIGLAMGAITLLVAVLVLLGTTPFGLPIADTVGLATVWLASLGAATLAVGALASVFVGGESDVGERAVTQAQLLRVGLFGALGLLFVATLLEPTAARSPTVGPLALVPTVGTLAALIGVALAVLTGVAARTAPADRERTLRREAALGLAAAAGFAVIVALHVALTGRPFSLGPLTIGVVGTLSWPMMMTPSIPLGAEPGGILPAVVGTSWLVVGASLFAVPLAVGAAIFLTEYAEQGKFTAVVEVATNALWSTPSIVFGLFGAAFLIPRFGGNESLIAGQLVLGFMLLPLVLITSREAIKAVPDEYRDASAALGVSKWETIKSVVLPAAIPGVITGGILGIGRIAGETAPLILVLGSRLNSTEAIDVLGGFQFMAQPPFVYNDALIQSAASLPTQVWAIIAAGVSGSPARGWASAFILLLVVLLFYAVGIFARTYFRRKLNYE